MSNLGIIVNTNNKSAKTAKANGVTGEKVCVHTIQAQDLRYMRPVAGASTLGMAIKLKG